jgi:hypothetical protein
MYINYNNIALELESITYAIEKKCNKFFGYDLFLGNKSWICIVIFVGCM